MLDQLFLRLSRHTVSELSADVDSDHAAAAHELTLSFEQAQNVSSEIDALRHTQFILLVLS